MFLRSTILACAAAMIVAPTVSAEAPARCEETSFRVYFQHGSASLNAMTNEMLQAAARNVADCDYAELRVSVSGPQAAQRGRAIGAAAGDWDAVRVGQRATHQAGYGPEYAEVTMSPNRSPDALTPPTENDAGV
ncbi:hypothetical protein [Terricaulis silvestris]|uniref:Uncharacterized protein n=1 Tax=Terricaulis silvestris TaxID=2686094 RepID=A0A6I6MPU4_9CAUL|nr:hypothetical protein [Terricaulis silvestris]QGZ96739.1 hypothetical protein DSM104635_03600 [Terricaulis silvestris]